MVSPGLEHTAFFRSGHPRNQGNRPLLTVTPAMLVTDDAVILFIMYGILHSIQSCANSILNFTESC